MNVEKAVRGGVKLATSGSVQILIGGLVAAVIPPQISLLYKAAAYLGGLVMASFVGEKLDGYVDEKIDEAKDMLKEITDNVSVTIEKAEAEEEAGA